MKQQKKYAKSNVGVDAHIDPHFKDFTLKNVGAGLVPAQKNHNGITLISLVITVVVLLILAGVAISIVVSPDGLFTKSEQAKTDWNAKVDEEQIKIDEALGYLGIAPATQISDQMPEGKGWDNTEEGPVDKVAKQGTRMAPIPKGYTVSEIPGENSITGGLVIYQTDTAVTGEPNSEAHITAMEGINQYVWIPVDDINDMVMCKHNNITQGSYEKNGETITTTTCKLEYVATTNQITCKTHNYSTATELTDDNIDTIGLAGRLYVMDATDADGDKIYQTSMAFTDASKNAHKFSTTETYREPDLVTTWDNSNYQLVLKEGTTQALTSANELKHQLNKKFIEMAKSVAKYGGFYISRFEPSYENSKVISKKNKKVLTAINSTYDTANFLAGDKWYGLYNKTLNNVDKDASVNSHMIWGCQYDQVIKFLGKEKGETGHTYQTKTQEKTGYNYVDDAGNLMVDQDILNNIYDLEGNNYEWTAQAYYSHYRPIRGSYYFDAYSAYNGFFPASQHRTCNPPDTTNSTTTRPTLYVAI